MSAGSAELTPAARLLTDGFGRVAETVHQVVAGLSREELDVSLEPGTNSISWLVWHLTRVQDDHIAEVAEVAQRWTAQNWRERFALPLEPEDTGYGHSREQAGQVRGIEPEVLTGYHDAVHLATTDYLDRITDADLDRVVDADWDPPVTLAVRLVSVLDDDIQHAGQAAFIAGVLARRGGS